MPVRVEFVRVGVAPDRRGAVENGRPRMRFDAGARRLAEHRTIALTELEA